LPDVVGVGLIFGFARFAILPSLKLPQERAQVRHYRHWPP
jgi:hypothetical protein